MHSCTLHSMLKYVLLSLTQPYTVCKPLIRPVFLHWTPWYRPWWAETCCTYITWGWGVPGNVHSWSLFYDCQSFTNIIHNSPPLVPMLRHINHSTSTRSISLKSVLILSSNFSCAFQVVYFVHAFSSIPWCISPLPLSCHTPSPSL